MSRNPYGTPYVARLLEEIDALDSRPKQMLSPVESRKKATPCKDCGTTIFYMSYRGRPPHYCRECRMARGLPETENTQKELVA